MPKAGGGLTIDLPDGRVLGYSDDGDPSGRAVILHPGTPETSVMGRWAHDAAVSAGVRLLSVDRPGYRGSTPTTEASLGRTGADTAAMAAGIGLREYAVVGLSGGGPFAVATAAADPSHVRALGVVGGIGPWRVLEDSSRDPEGSKCLALHDAGDVAGAWECMRRDVEQAYAVLAMLDDGGLADWMMARVGVGSRLSEDQAYRALWAENLRVVAGGVLGSVYDNIAWGASWDVDPHDVTVPTMLWYGELDERCPLAHGRWYADRIPDSRLVILPGEGHVDVMDAHWPDVLAGLLGIWRSGPAPPPPST
jgi:pimeloyl-ACP methyl ester carboxylesterase